VRIEHLREGTQSDNSRDMVQRGRHYQPGLKGARHPNSKLTEDDVRETRRRFSSGATLGELAEVFGVSRDNIGLIVRRKAWRHVS